MGRVRVLLAVGALAAAVLAFGQQAVPRDRELGPVPSDLVGFCRWTVQDRAKGGLARIVRDADSPKYGTVYGGQAEDANIAWVAAAAYRHTWSRHCGDAVLREDAFFLLDALARIRADGRWDDGGHGSKFGLHSFAWAVWSWLETGEVEAERAATWRKAVAAAADDAIRCMQRDACSGQYANPEFYYLAGLAAAGRITGNASYTEEAARALRRYENVLWPGGGVAYFHETSPQHGYQQMVTKSVVLYWLATDDEYALSWLKRLAPYFVNVQHRSGLVTDAEQPWLKHSFYNPVNPAVPGMLACILGDGANRWAAEIAAGKRADNVANRLPSFLDKNPNWYNYHHTTYAATLVGLLESRDLPDAVDPGPRRLLRDGGFQGVRSHWDLFTAAVGTRHKNDSLAGAYVADPAEPMMPLASGLDGVFAEILWGDRDPAKGRSAVWAATYSCLDWVMETHYVDHASVKAASAWSRLCAPYWNDRPWLPGERWRVNQVAGWSSLQHWAVWRDHLVGLCLLHCHADGGSVETDDQARLRWRFAPVGRELLCARDEENGSLDAVCGELRVRMRVLGERGGFGFAEIDDQEPPRIATAPVLVRAAPWQAGDFVMCATDARPAGSDTEVRVKALNEAAAAVMVEPGGARAHVWIASLGRHVRQHHLAPVAGVKSVRVFERDVELTPPFPGEEAVLSLHGGESALFELTADGGLTAEGIVTALSSGWGRGEARPKR